MMRSMSVTFAKLFASPIISFRSRKDSANPSKVTDAYLLLLWNL